MGAILIETTPIAIFLLGEAAHPKYTLKVESSHAPEVRWPNCQMVCILAVTALWECVSLISY